MAQASSSWQQIINQIPNWKLKSDSSLVKKRRSRIKSLHRFQGPGGSLGLLTVIVAMGVWNWKLLFATGMGISTMVFAYSLQAWQWQQFWQEIRQFIYSPNRRIVMAILSGGIATVSSYTGMSLWFELENHWTATAVIIQGLATVLILILLVWQITSLYGRDADHKLERIFADLTNPDPLKRLLAIRQLSKFCEGMQVDPQTKQTILDCLNLLLTREDETIVREAAFTSLQILEQSADSHLATPLKPLKIKHKQQVGID